MGSWSGRTPAQIWEANAPAWIELSRAGLRRLPRSRQHAGVLRRSSRPSTVCFGLDLGCGEGHNTRLLAAEGAEVDRARHERAVHPAAASKSPADGLRFVLADGAVLPFATRRFDFVTGFMSLMDVADPETTLREVAAY